MPFEVVLVDNASTDGSAAFVRERFPAVRVIESGQNLGFTGGNNLIAKAARGQYLLLLNCDTVLKTDVTPGVRILQREPEVGIVGARMFDGDGRVQPNTGHFPAAWRLWLFKWQWSKPFAQPFGDPALQAYAHDWVEGSFLLTSRENWQAVGGMDEAGFMYGEDVEFCTHTRERGLRTVQCAAMSYQHFGGYNEDRMPFLYAGYRRVHASSARLGHPRRAELVLLLGLVPRLMVYSVLALVTRRATLRNKTRRFWEVLRRWKELAPKPSTRRPSVGSPCGVREYPGAWQMP